MAVVLDYVTLEEFSDVMPEEEQAEATDDSYGEDGTITSSGPTRDDQMVKRFLKRAESFANSYLSFYERPVNPVPHTLKYTVMILARYYLDERADGSVSEDIQQSYNNAMDWLKDIRDGEIDLGGDVEEQTGAYFGERAGGAFEEGPFSDKSSTLRGRPLG